MTSDSWQSQWEKSILTVCEIHGVTNKGHSCSSMLGAALVNFGAYRGTPPVGPLPHLCLKHALPFLLLLLPQILYKCRKQRYKTQWCTWQSSKALLLYIFPALCITVSPWIRCFLVRCIFNVILRYRAKVGYALHERVEGWNDRDCMCLDLRMDRKGRGWCLLSAWQLARLFTGGSEGERQPDGT